MYYFFIFIEFALYYFFIFTVSIFVYGHLNLKIVVGVVVWECILKATIMISGVYYCYWNIYYRKWEPLKYVWVFILEVVFTNMLWGWGFYCTTQA